MVYCSNCGALCTDDFNYCPKCGTKLENKSVSEKTEEATETFSEADNSIEDNAWHAEY
jgi:uncharacterized OB-fold protein